MRPPCCAPPPAVRAMMMMRFALPPWISAATPSRSNGCTSGARGGAAARRRSTRSTPSSCSTCAGRRGGLSRGLFGACAAIELTNILSVNCARRRCLAGRAAGRGGARPCGPCHAPPRGAATLHGAPAPLMRRPRRAPGGEQSRRAAPPGRARPRRSPRPPHSHSRHLRQCRLPPPRRPRSPRRQRQRRLCRVVPALRWCRHRWSQRGCAAFCGDALRASLVLLPLRTGEASITGTEGNAAHSRELPRKLISSVNFRSTVLPD